jgi:hypothetical protein
VNALLFHALTVDAPNAPRTPSPFCRLSIWSCPSKPTCYGTPNTLCLLHSIYNVLLKSAPDPPLPNPTPPPVTYRLFLAKNLPYSTLLFLPLGTCNTLHSTLFFVTRRFPPPSVCAPITNTWTNFALFCFIFDLYAALAIHSPSAVVASKHHPIPKLLCDHGWPDLVSSTLHTLVGLSIPATNHHHQRLHLYITFPSVDFTSFYMSDLGQQLARLGISQYLEVFIAEGFDTWETILDITESDLWAKSILTSWTVANDYVEVHSTSNLVTEGFVVFLLITLHRL